MSWLIKYFNSLKSFPSLSFFFFFSHQIFQVAIDSSDLFILAGLINHVNSTRASWTRPNQFYKLTRCMFKTLHRVLYFLRSLFSHPLFCEAPIIPPYLQPLEPTFFPPGALFHLYLPTVLCKAFVFRTCFNVFDVLVW